MLAAPMLSIMASSMVVRSSVPALARGAGAPRSLAVVCAAADLEAKVNAAIAADDVVVFSKSWCPFCGKTKSLLDGLEVEYNAIELDEMDDGAEMQAGAQPTGGVESRPRADAWLRAQDTLLAMTGQRTVPNVFIKGTHVGGNDGARTRTRPHAMPGGTSHTPCASWCADTQKKAASGELQKMLGIA